MDTAVLVHGLWMPPSATILLGRRLRAAGFAVHRFSYASVRVDLDANAARLAAFLRRVPGETLHFVGHSLGGPVILRMLEDFACERPGRVVCLGSPLTGSQAAARLLNYRGGRQLLGKSMLGLLEHGPFSPWTGPRELGIIAGRVPFGVGHLLARFDGPHDGTVAVAETCLAGATDHIVLPVTHMLLLWSAEVARQATCFLRQGRFAHAPRASAISS